MKSEIKTNETPEVKNPNVENFKEIKPETSMSVNEAKDFWENKFRETEERTPEDQEFHDDNGKLYVKCHGYIPIVPSFSYTIKF